VDLLAIIQPEVVIIGGGVGTHFDKYGKLLETELKKYQTPLVPIPPIRAAQRPEEAVIYGCYELVKETYGSPVTAA
jgi:glucokinase